MMQFRPVMALLAVGALAACGGSQTSQRPTPQPGAAATRPTTPTGGPRAYRAVIPDSARSDSGVFTTHRVGDKVFYEIPRAMFGKEFLLVTRIAQTHNNIGYGGEQQNAQVLRWVRQGNNILLRVATYQNVSDSTRPIADAVRASNYEAIIASLAIESFGADSAAVVDVTSLFTTDIPMLGLSRQERQQYGVTRLDPARTYVSRVASYPTNVEVRHVITYAANTPPANASTGSISLEMSQSMVMLPEHPMQPRLWDGRVGFFANTQTDYGLDEQRAAQRRYIARWRLEPSDTAAFLRGELVEPIKPIVYYVDPATPAEWAPYLKQGVDDWNVAFERAGFRNAIRGAYAPTPEEDPEFSPEDARYSVIRYFSSPVQNAYGPSVRDPRTGEILESDIGWFHNVMNLLRNWYFVQTAAANPDARGTRFAPEVMGQLVRFVSAHEVGHTLGLPHNMKASAAYPVDSLRSAAFTCRMGTAPSIMDYARFNYVAQPEDEGVCFFPGIGEYDKYAIHWGYRPIIGATTPDAERETLDRWIREHEGDPMYRFGDPSSIDPTQQTEALGNDGIRASELGIANLRRIVPNLLTWAHDPMGDYSHVEELYGQVIGQWGRYMGHVSTVVGGITEVRKTEDQAGEVYTVIPEADQRRAMRFFAEQAFATPAWMLDWDILSRIEHAGAVNNIRARQVGVLNNLLTFERLQRLIESEARIGNQAYTLLEMMDDLRGSIWTELASRLPTDVYRRNLQRGYIERMEFLMTQEQPPAGGGFGGGGGANRTNVDVSQSDIRSAARGQLTTLQGEIERALRAGVSDRPTREHLQDAVARIERILDPRE
ncbi:MAG: zinc-dependent metalloprotease [Gemmatimonadales bacterium]